MVINGGGSFGAAPFAILAPKTACWWTDRSHMVEPRGLLRRSRSQRIIAGVCGGFAEWLGWDVRLVRALYVLVSVFSAAFPGILAYIILWVLIPEE